MSLFCCFFFFSSSKNNKHVSIVSGSKSHDLDAAVEFYSVVLKREFCSYMFVSVVVTLTTTTSSFSDCIFVRVSTLLETVKTIKKMT